jgi:hypothetical protein
MCVLRIHLVPARDLRYADYLMVDREPKRRHQQLNGAPGEHATVHFLGEASLVHVAT